MSESLSVEIKASLAWLWEEALELSTLVDSSKLEVQAALSAGDGPGEADQIWHDTRTLAATSNDDLDLTALVQTIHGQSVSLGFAALKAILIHNTSDTDALVIDSSVSNGLTAPFAASATSKLEIPASSPLLLVNKLAGWTVTAGTGDVLRIGNAGSTEIQYKIVIVGTAA
jgi:hypothetical protein